MQKEDMYHGYAVPGDGRGDTEFVEEVNSVFSILEVGE
jgi:hypothetical protein